MPIDVFLRSLAQHQQDHAIGVVLSAPAATARWRGGHQRRGGITSPRMNALPNILACPAAHCLALD